jgi:hypothetical protein
MCHRPADHIPMVDLGRGMFPVAIAKRIKTSRNGSELIYITCPLCNREHVHGQGSGNTANNLGHRSARCEHKGKALPVDFGYIIFRTLELAELTA